MLSCQFNLAVCFSSFEFLSAISNVTGHLAGGQLAPQRHMIAQSPAVQYAQGPGSIMIIRLTIFTSLSLFLSTACGGSASPQPAAPEDPVEAPAEEPIEEPKAEEEPVDDGPSGPTGGTPKEIVESEGVRFVLAFNNSDVGIKAGERCDSKHKSDPKGRNQCMKAARATVKEDVMHFQLGSLGKWVWTTSTQRGSTLQQLKQVNFTWGEETKNSIEIQTSRGEKVMILVPNNYSIVIEHPTHGKLTYDSKRSD